jgi:hypothetical protein
MNENRHISQGPRRISSFNSVIFPEQKFEFHGNRWNESGNSGKTLFLLSVSTPIKVVTGDLLFFYHCLLGASVKSHKAAAGIALSFYMGRKRFSWAAFLEFYV